ncbi:MAG: hypothetical protein COU31_00060 [Candidatus Magasanikbacteria bacterium CG10_big_fil_rev_8_21_14_0_10_40_10]|uniref:CBS domain-containing protein n=1 Tax=Candidatus Magasanikbacteria bacterium CG10_big_fil_rev_8_21_14_0_10_40_10 TaxID=1974648 RepID=A0A2M6W569_9BACT|nr:MAG: hypothetical protein COU31_00060 [Candidatus Magasanikbacteria bacterium CG10_big_fil_rev_8_21_14_0_10_40_10]
MLYLSDIIGASILDQTNSKIGRVMDLAVKNDSEQNYPPVLGIVVKNKKDQDVKFIKIKDIERFSEKKVVIKKYYDEVAGEFLPDKEAVYLKKTVLDRQIVDLEGVRIVRVNDLQLGFIKDIMSLVAIDIGQAGLFRRLSFFSTGKKELLEWKDIRLLGNKIQLSTSAKDINKLHPADVANLIEKMNLNQGSLLLESMEEHMAARVLEEIEPEIQKILIEKLGPSRAAGLIQRMSVDELVDLIQLLPKHESKQFMEELPANTKKQHVRNILEYDEDTAGGLMTTEYISAYPEDTVDEVVQTIRRINHIHNSIYFIYVIDRTDKFMGVVSLRRLITADRTEKINKLMKSGKKIPTAKVDDELLEVANLMTKYNLYSTAVLDEEQRLLGVVTVDDIMRHFVPHA